MNKDDFYNSKYRISDTSASFRLKQDYNFKTKTLHVFVEASDDYNFYLKSIEKVYYDFELFSYPKDGKKFVLGAYSSMDWNKYDKSRVLFFVDKDYEDILGHSSKKDVNIFVTKYYSIENYLSSSKVFKYCLKEIFKIKSDNIVKALVDQYENSFVKFQSEMIMLTAVILIYRSNESHLVLEKLKMEEFFFIKNMKFDCFKFRNKIVCDTIKKSDCDSSIKAAIVNTKKIEAFKKAEADITEINYKLVLKNIRNLKNNHDCRYYIRGKYQLWFFIKFLSNTKQASAKINQLIQNENSTTGFENTNMAVNIEINESNIFDLLPMKLPAFSDINIFLIQNRHKYNE